VSVAAISLAAAFATTNTKPSAPPPKAQAQEPAQQPTPVQKTFPLNTYVARGFPLLVSNAVVVSTRGASEKSDAPATARFTVANRDTARINSLTLTIFEFQGNRLRRVDGWIRDVALNANATADITLDLARRVTAGDKLILAIERTNGPSATRDVNFLALAVNASASGVPPDTPVTSAGQPLPDDVGPSFCHNVLRRVMTLKNAGDRTSVTALSCDQADRSYTFSFNNKALNN
jgi:hypothetical protein